MKDNDLPLPSVRCLSKEAVACCLGIGVTLLSELDLPAVKFGRRLVYDKVDLDVWLEEYKRRGRAGKENLWLNKTEFTADLTLGAGGLMQRSKMVKEYEKALGLKVEKKLKLI